MKQITKIAYINRFSRAGIEDVETKNTLRFMNDFYEYDKSREPSGFTSIHSRPNSQLEKIAFAIGATRKMNKAISKSNKGFKSGPQKKWNDLAASDRLKDKIKTRKGSFNAA